jgi:hypothetical protein
MKIIIYTFIKLQSINGSIQLHHHKNTVEPLITDTAGEFKFCPL